MNTSLVTFTSCVSDLTYCGHPSVDQNLIDCSPAKQPWPTAGHHYRCLHTKPVPTLLHLKSLLSRYGQPVTWVINDNEYQNLNGTLPYLKKFQAEGDAILVTFEIVQRPSPVDRRDTEAVLRYAERQCRSDGLRIDGVWSLKYLPDDLRALAKLSAEFPWAANLAGSCWMQGNHVDDSGWKGCPFGPYYPNVQNVKASVRPHSDDVRPLLMMPWLTRDFATGIRMDRIEPYGLDPADPSRPEIGGFDSVKDSGKYLAKVLNQTLLNAPHAGVQVIRLHEEVRCYFDEGHDKDDVIAQMFDEIARHGDGCRKVTLAEAFDIYRTENPFGAQYSLYSGASLDWRYPQDAILLYEDGDCQLHFLRSLGSRPYRLYDYTTCKQDRDGLYYPEAILPAPLLDMQRTDNEVRIRLDVQPVLGQGSRYALAVWGEPMLHRVEADIPCRHLETHDGNHLLLFRLQPGSYMIRLV